MSHEKVSSEKEKKKQVVNAFRAIGYALAFLLAPLVVLSRYLSDERRMTTLCRLYVPQSKWPKRDPLRKKAIRATIALSILYLLAASFLFYVYLWVPAGKMRGVFDLPALPRAGIVEKASLWLALLSWAASVALGYVVYYSPFSATRRLKKVFEQAGMEQNLGKKGYWYYPNALVYMDLVGTIGEEVVKKTSLWRQSGFLPTEDPVLISGSNEVVITGCAQKTTNSTYIYDRYDEWTETLEDPTKTGFWFLGEYVQRNELKFKDIAQNTTLAFIGTTGSGKTEGIKMFLTWAKCKYPTLRLVISDLKMTGDYDRFAPFTETGRIIKTVEETLLAIAYMQDVMNRRVAYMQEKGYNSISAWAEAENVDVPPILLIVDEYPTITGALKYEFYCDKDKTPAATKKMMFTRGRSYGTWFGLGTQFGTSDAVPSQINANMKARVCFRVGREAEAHAWTQCDGPFFIGRGKVRDDGLEDPQSGYAYIDCKDDYVRFWYIPDYLIVHELMKYGVPTIDGAEYPKVKPPAYPNPGLQKRLKAVGGDAKKLSLLDQDEIKSLERANAKFAKSFEKLEASPHPRLKEKLTPLGTLWDPNETVEDYYERIDERNPNRRRSADGGGGAAPRPSRLGGGDHGRADGPRGGVSPSKRPAQPEASSAIDEERLKKAQERRKRINEKYKAAISQETTKKD